MENLKESQTTSLYKRLGGAEGIASISSDAVDQHLKNPVVSARYKQSDISKVKKLAFEFFAMGTGGPEAYTGRNMLDTHRGMNISEQEFMEVVDDILNALEMNNIKQKEKDEVLAILFSMRKEIVRV
jgi:hemoglobin